MTGAARERRLVFGEVAETYDAVRPGYPAQLVEDVLDFARLPRAARALEIGCGTGKATLPFAERGLRIDALEPNPGMGAVARRNLAAFPEVRVHEASFESWTLEPAAFDLVFSAQAIHWVPPEIRFTRSARALRPGGTLAVFGHKPTRGEEPVHQAIEAAYVARAEDFAARLPGEQPSFPGEYHPVDQVDDTGSYETAFEARYRWHADYERDRYIQLLETQSDHRMLADTARALLLEEIAAAIDAHGGSVRIRYDTHLLLVRRRGGSDG